MLSFLHLLIFDKNDLIKDYIEPIEPLKPSEPKLDFSAHIAFYA